MLLDVCRTLFVLLSLFFWSLCRLSFFDLRIYGYRYGIFKLFLTREQNYSTVEKECLVNVRAIESLKYHLSGYKFTVENDHGPLTWLYRMKDKNQRLLRWLLTVQTV